MAKTPKIAEASTVREWAEEHGWEVAGRGRFNSDLIRAFNNDRDNKRKGVYYEPRPRNERQPLGTPNDRPSNTPAERKDVPAPRTSPEAKAEVTVVDAEDIADSIPASVLEMLRAASSKGGTGNQAVVTIHALVNI